MKKHRTITFRLKYNTYQHAYLTLLSKYYTLGVKLISEWLFHYLKQYRTNYHTILSHIEYEFTRNRFESIPGLPVRLVQKIYNILPSSIKQNIFKEAKMIVKSRLEKPQIEYHFNIHYFGFTWSDISQKGMELTMPRSKHLRSLFNDPVKIRIPKKVYESLNTSRWFLQFRYRNGKWFVYIVYELKITKTSENRVFSAIDLNISDICLIDEVNKQPILLSLTSVNRKVYKWFKRYSRFMSLGDIKRAKKYRDKIVHHYKSTFKLYAVRIIQYLKECGVNRLVYGNVEKLINKGNLNRHLRRLWNMIPWSYFIDYLISYGEKYGIYVYKINEAYTSKASFLDNDPIPENRPEKIKQNIEFSGKRISRGLYKARHGVVIHADVNAAANILRRAMSRFDKRLVITAKQLSSVRRLGVHILSNFTIQLSLELKKLRDRIANPGSFESGLQRVITAVLHSGGNPGRVLRFLRISGLFPV